MFILIHHAEAGLTNSETKVLAANMSQYGQVAFSHVNYIVVPHNWGHGKKQEDSLVAASYSYTI